MLSVARDTYAAMLAHARRAVPDEAVGFLAGPGRGCATRCWPLRNAAGPGRFLADPRAQYEAEREIARAGLQRVAIYHSHPGGGAALSDLDRAFAAARDELQVVVGLCGGAATVRAYRVRTGRVETVPLVVAGPAPVTSPPPRRSRA